LADHPAIDLHFTDPHSPGGPDDALQDRIYAALDDFNPLAIQEAETGDRWRVFFRSADVRDRAAAAVLNALPAQLVEVSSVDVPDDDWARRSQQNLTAVRAGRLVIAPPWDVPKSAGDPVIIIEPSTGFGTGHHATTRLCLEMLQRLELRGARVIDVGTGSGVLALAAWKLGASDVVAIDNDPDALENARANFATNGAGPSIDVVLDQLESLRIERADVVLANLTGAMLLRCSGELTSLLRDDGYLVVSGFAPDEAHVVKTAFKSLRVIEEQVDGDWAALCLSTRQRTH
jgi:ribosomal protein L11 methyltransferase